MMRATSVRDQVQVVVEEQQEKGEEGGEEERKEAEKKRGDGAAWRATTLGGQGPRSGDRRTAAAGGT